MVDIPSQQAVMTSETQFPSKIFEKINQRLKSVGDIDMVQLTDQGHQGITFKMIVDGQSFLIKKTNKVGPIARGISKSFIQHEYNIYQKLEGITGIPKCYGLTDDGCLILEFIEGDSYRKKEHILENRDQFFSHLLSLILSIHDAGVTHGDLKRKDNILIGDKNQPYLIDFGTAMTISSKINALSAGFTISLNKRISMPGLNINTSDNTIRLQKVILPIIHQMHWIN